METEPNIGSAELSRELRRVGRTRTFRPGEEIFAAGETAEFLPVVLSGRVKVVRYLEAGKEIILNVFRAGEVFAIPPILDGRSYPATAIAMEETRLLLVYRRDFFDLLEGSEEFSSLILSRMSFLMREMTSSVENLATASSEKRVARVLLRLAAREERGEPLVITLRRQDIAEMAGLTTETTIRAVRRLAERGLIGIVRGKIHLGDTEKLRSFTGS